jgi:hypothetical protein
MSFYSGNTNDSNLALPIQLSDSLFEIAKLGPTILPILFSVIISAFLRLTARWKAEKGSSIKVSVALIGVSQADP